MSAQRQYEKSRRELARNVAAGGLTTGLGVALLNPLDSIRIRYQTSPQSSATPPVSMRAFAAHLLREEGLLRLWRSGAVVNVASVTMSSGLRQGLYPTVRDAMMHQGSLDDKSVGVMWLAGLTTGAIGFALATPLFSAKILAQMTNSAYPQDYQALRHVCVRSNPFNGASVLVIRGALISAGASTGYDAMKTVVKATWGTAVDGPGLHLAGSVCAAFLATTWAAPFDTLLTRYQASAVKEESPLACAKTMWREGGPRVFFRGWSMFFGRVAPLWMLQLPMYEQARRLLGMTYMD